VVLFSPFYFRAAVSACLYARLSCLHRQALAAYLTFFRQIKTMTMMMISFDRPISAGVLIYDCLDIVRYKSVNGKKFFEILKTIITQDPT